MGEIVKVNAAELKSFGDKEAEVVTGDERVTARKDDLIIVPKGLKRGIKALTELSILHVVQPPPSDEDHSQVHARLAEGRFE
jgi:mannose-6-phosphate isomerase-like protein (cupin superfamily)